MKLGKKPPRCDTRTLKLASFLRASLPTAPETVTWSKKVNGWSAYANTEIGDCTLSTAGNLIQCWSANGQIKEIELPEWLVVATYTHLSGFDPADPSTDSGLAVLDVLNYWRKVGVGDHRIEAFTEVDLKRLDEVRAGIWLFGGLYGGLALPEAWENRFDVWDTGQGQAYRRGSWGPHAVPIVDYNKDGVVIETWGATRLVTWRAFGQYGDEAYACIASDFLTNGRAPNGFDVAALRSALQVFHPVVR